jgi:hypothetical protein
VHEWVILSTDGLNRVYGSFWSQERAAYYAANIRDRCHYPCRVVHCDSLRGGVKRVAS